MQPSRSGASQPTAPFSLGSRGEKLAMTWQVIERYKLSSLTKIAQGGQGVVYQAPNVTTRFAASMVYKEYKPKALAEINFTASAAMPDLVEDSLSHTQAERLISIAAWPCALIEDADALTGFIMPSISDDFFTPLVTVKGASSTAAEFQHLLNHPSILDARGIRIDDTQRYALLREVASALVFLHSHRVCVGDISPKNLLFRLKPSPAVYFIDCDAMRINGISVPASVRDSGMGGSRRRGTGHHLHRYLQTRPARPAATHRRSRHHEPPAPAPNHAEHVAPDHYRHVGEAAR